MGALLRSLLTGPALLLAIVAAPQVVAQVALFDAGDYGKMDLLPRESTGDAGAFIAAQDGAFEPVHELPAGDPIRRMASAVGRIDLLIETANGNRSLVTCSGALLPENWVLTNHHCIPGEERLLSASILLGYLVQGGEGAARYALSVNPADWHPQLDYSLVQLLEPAAPRFARLRLQPVVTDPRAPLIVIHHPLGRPQVMTRFRCFSTGGQAGDHGHDATLRHRCDTLPGSSGAILFDRAMTPVALHHSGGMTAEDARSFNRGTRIRALLAQSQLLRRLTVPGRGTGAATAPDPAPPSAAEDSKSADDGVSADTATDLLRGN